MFHAVLVFFFHNLERRGLHCCSSKVSPCCMMLHPEKCVYTWAHRKWDLVLCITFFLYNHDHTSYSNTICFLLCQRSIGLPDVHSGYGFAIGNMAAFDMSNPDAVVSPGLFTFVGGLKLGKSTWIYCWLGRLWPFAFGERVENCMPVQASLLKTIAWRYIGSHCLLWHLIIFVTIGYRIFTCTRLPYFSNPKIRKHYFKQETEDILI